MILRELIARIQLSRNQVNFHRKRGVRIGANVDIYGSHVWTFGSEPYLVTIGDNVTISHDVDFITHDGGLRVIRDREPGAFFYAPIVVGDGAFIGARAVLLPGSRVGAGTVIAAGAVVAGEIPPNVVAGGVPARTIKSVESYAEGHRADWVDTAGLREDEKARLLKAKWS